MKFETIKLEKRNGIATITLSRPKVLNAINSKMLSELLQVLKALKNDEDIRVLLIRGEGKAFAAGADIEELQNGIGELKFESLGNEVFSEIENLPLPVIACINGYALGGGCELALACDLRIAGDGAKFGLPEVKLGVHPGWGGTQRLPRLIGRGRAKELIFTGKIIPAKKAKEHGLIEHLVKDEKLMDFSMKMAREIVENAPIALRLSKECINKGLEMDLENAIRFENNSVKLCFLTRDAKEGMRAFVEKRKPIFERR